MYRPIAKPVSLFAVLVLSSCSSTTDPFNAMCENIVANLMASSQPGFSDMTRTESGDGDLLVSLNFSRGENLGTAVCHFASIEDEDEIDQDDYDASPYKVVLNGQTVDNKQLINATLNATRGMIKEGVENASDKVNEVARDAAEAAREVAHDTAEKVQRSLEK